MVILVKSLKRLKAIIIGTGSNDAIALTDMQLAGKRMLVANYLSGVQESLVGKQLI